MNDVGDFIYRATNGRLSRRPEYYSGRGPNPGDLNGTHLKQLHTLLLQEEGEAVAEAFIGLVTGLKDLSATNFLNQFYAWCWNGFQPTTLRETGIDVGPDGPGRETVGLATIFSVLGRDQSWDTSVSESIRNDFLFRVGKPVDVRKCREWAR